MAFNTPINTQSRLASVLGVSRVDYHATFLGLPMLLGRNKTVFFSIFKGEDLEKKTQKVA